MATKKKEETVLEKIAEAAEKVVEKIEGVVEEAVEKVVGEKKTVKKKVVKKKTVSKKSKLDELKEKAKELEKKVKESGNIDIKEKVTGEKEDKKDTLLPIEDYLKSSIHLGTRVITPHMRKYVYRRRADGLAVFNTAMLDDELRAAAKYLSQFNPEDIVVVCKREAGWNAVRKFADTLGIKVFTKKYPAGTLTNPNLADFFERDLVFICDPWIDKNALNDSNKIKIKVMSICDTNNFTFGIDHILPGNNKSAKSLGFIFYLLTKMYIEDRKMDIEIPSIDEFVEGWENLVPPK
jgi:small subunit ribosomal protein S2